MNAGSRAYRVQACNSSGCSAYSSTSNTIITDYVPSSMMAPVASLTGNDLTLSWVAIANANYYNLQYRDGAAAWATANSTYTGNSKFWADVAPVNSRTYRMQACNESGCSDWSAASNAITIGTVSVSLSWIKESVSVGESVILTWDISGYSSCYFTNDPQQEILPAIGSQAIKFYEIGFLNYPMQCVQNGQTTSFNEYIQVYKLAAPVDLNSQ